MNVTSLLNDRPETRPRWWTEPEKCSAQNRTPWDAEGYSLPMQGHPGGIFNTLAPLNESPLENHINEFGHKMSNSSSSFSSFTSSNTTSHSRLSSTSTLGSLYPYNPANADTDFRPSKASSSCSSPVSPSSGRPRHYLNWSLADCVNKLALVAEHSTDLHLPDEEMDRPALSAEIVPIELKKQLPNCKLDGLSMGAPRPMSPSDAVFMGRSKPFDAPYLSQFPDLVVTQSYDRSELPLIPEAACNVLGQAGHLTIEAKSHKRALSAPDFQRVTEGTAGNDYRSSTSPGPIANMTPPSSPHQNTASPGNHMFLNTPSTPPDLSPLLQNRKPCCMYITDCDTGSQLRKAVSHIFGRNKMCTRRIPIYVWVWYCRKHYQRARYRNSKEWARTLQYDLVTKQIDRLQQWSDENRRVGGDVVRDYELAIRKREQRRIDAQKSRRDHDFSDSEEDMSGDVRDDTPSTTAVPDWLLNRSGRNYNADAIRQIIDGIKEDLASGKLSAWPDIEILPNIVKDDNERGPSTGPASRRPATITHKRSQSLSAAQKTYFSSTYQGVSQTKVMHSTGHSFSGGLSQKRKRFDNGDEDDEEHESLENRLVRGNSQGTANEVLSTRHGSFENPSRIWDPQKFSHEDPKSRVFAPQSYDALSRILRVTSDVSVLDSVSPRSRNAVHQRSHSAVGALFNPQPLSHTSANDRVGLPSTGLDDPGAHRHSLSPRSHPPQAEVKSSEQRPQLHSRHQSTPLISNPFRTFQAKDAIPQSYQPLLLISALASRTPPRSEERLRESSSLNGKKD